MTCERFLDNKVKLLPQEPAGNKWPRQDLNPGLAAPKPKTSHWPQPSLPTLCASSQLTSVDSPNWSLALEAETGWCLGAERSVRDSNGFYYLAHGWVLSIALRAAVAAAAVTVSETSIFPAMFFFFFLTYNVIKNPGVFYENSRKKMKCVHCLLSRSSVNRVPRLLWVFVPGIAQGFSVSSSASSGMHSALRLASCYYIRRDFPYNKIFARVRWNDFVKSNHIDLLNVFQMRSWW